MPSHAQREPDAFFADADFSQVVSCVVDEYRPCTAREEDASTWHGRRRYARPTLEL